MSMEWHRSEPREVRPFFAAQSASAALDQSGIRLTADGEISTGTSFELDDPDLLTLAPTVFPAVLNPQMWLPEGFAASDLRLLIIARQPLLKRSELVGSYSLAETTPEAVEIPIEMMKALGGGRNTQVVLAIVLAEDRAPEPGSPFVRGHWLAKKTFAFRTRSTPVLFDIRPRTDEEWVANGYPAKTLYAVEYMSGIESEPDEGINSVAVVHVHADAHVRLGETKLGEAVQPLLAAEIVTSILQQSLSDWENLESAPKGSALETLVTQLSKVEPISVAKLASLIRTNPSRVRALAQSRYGVVQSLR